MLLFSLFNPCEARRKIPVLFCARPLHRSVHDLSTALCMTSPPLGVRPLHRIVHDPCTARCTTPAQLFSGYYFRKETCPSIGNCWPLHAFCEVHGSAGSVQKGWLAGNPRGKYTKEVI